MQNDRIAVDSGGMFIQVHNTEKYTPRNARINTLTLTFRSQEMQQNGLIGRDRLNNEWTVG